MDIIIEMKKNFYNNVDPRRKQELKDSNMIQEDPREMSNLPNRFIHREFNQDEFVEHLDMFNQDQNKEK